MTSRNCSAVSLSASLIGLLLLVIMGCATPAAEKAPYQGGTIRTQTSAGWIDRGPGAEHCKELHQTLTLIEAEQFDEAQTMLDTMLARFAEFDATGKRVVSFGSGSEYEEFAKTDDDPASIVPVDACYAEIIGRKGFIAAENHDYLTALELLERSANASPTMAGAFVERGYVLRRLGRFQEATSSYEDAIRLAERYPSSSNQLPLALRGLGYCLVELDRLDDAEAAYRRSLEIDPGNELGLHELRYIESLRRRPH